MFMTGVVRVCDAFLGREMLLKLYLTSGVEVTSSSFSFQLNSNIEEMALHSIMNCNVADSNAKCNASACGLNQSGYQSNL